MTYQIDFADTLVLILYAVVLIVMGIVYMRKSKTSEQFMVAGRGIPAWAAGLAVMSAYTSSISYIAVPGKAYDTNWHPLIFALMAICSFIPPLIDPMYQPMTGVDPEITKSIGPSLTHWTSSCESASPQARLRLNLKRWISTSAGNS